MSAGGFSFKSIIYLELDFKHLDFSHFVEIYVGTSLLYISSQKCFNHNLIL